MAAIPLQKTRAGWRKLDLETLATIWHLFRGGVTDPAQIRALTKTQVNGPTINGIVSCWNRLLGGPLPLQSPVRCRNCGTKLIDLPCRVCTEMGESYRMITV